MPTATADKIYIVVHPFVTGRRGYSHGERLRDDDPIVQSHRQFLVEDGTPREQWPTPWDTVTERQAEEERAAEAELERAARKRKIKLELRVAELQRDLVLRSYRGQPALLQKGSRVAADDELVALFPDAWRIID